MRKFKKIILLIFIISTNTFSQINVQYSFYQNIVEESNIEIDPIFKEINEYSKDILFELIINDTISKFSLTKKLDKNEFDIRQSFAQKVIMQGEYFTNIKNGTTIQEMTEVCFLLSNSDNKWKLYDETKFINEFKCYKATTTKQVINTRGIFNFKIVAWYCPLLPYSFGPKEFNGLPGLILELKDTHYTFIVNKIKPVLIDETKISEPKCKIISKEEYLKKLKNNSFFNQE